MSDTRYHSIGFRWSHPYMSGLHDLVLDLDSWEEQAAVQPHITALVDFWREKQRRKVEAEALAGRADPLGMA